MTLLSKIQAKIAQAQDELAKMPYWQHTLKELQAKERAAQMLLMPSEELLEQARREGWGIAESYGKNGPFIFERITSRGVFGQDEEMEDYLRKRTDKETVKAAMEFLQEVNPREYDRIFVIPLLPPPEDLK